MNAKKLIIGLAVCVLCSCGQTKEEKAQQMAAEYLNGEIYNFESYEPIQTKVDSSFISLSSDKDAIELTLDMLKLLKTTSELAEEVENAKRMMAIWEPCEYSNAYSLERYEQEKNEMDKKRRLLDKTKERVETLFQKIKERQSVIKSGDFNGWKVYHKFRSLNAEGSFSGFGEYVFFCDKDFNVDMAYSKDVLDIMSKILDVIGESDDITEFAEQAQEIIF